jgi:peptidase C25-like protein
MLIAKYFTLTLLLICNLSNAVYAQENSVLASGTWLKLAVNTTSINKITYQDLQSYGLNPGDIDPTTIRLFNNGSGMLPQAISSTRVKDLNEVAISVVGQGDGSFDVNDYILFYANGPDFIEYDSISNVFNYQKHLFSNFNYYFLNFNQSSGKRVAEQALQPAGTIITSAYDVYTHEEELINILHSGRKWFGEKFDLETTQSFLTDQDNIDGTSNIVLVSSVMSSSLRDANFKVKLNGVEIGSQPIGANPEGTYAKKGTARVDTFTISKNMIDDKPLEITYFFEKEFGVGYLDYFLIQTKRKLRYADEPLRFYTGDLNNQGNITFSISDCPSGLVLWDISDHNNITEVNYSQTGTTITFNASGTSTSFVLFDPLAIQRKPESSRQIANQNLHARSSTDLLIVAPAIFQSHANIIADLRSAEGLTVKIVTPDQIFNEFSSGMPDITAIRDYAKYLYDNAGLKYLLMFGKGTYDPKDILSSQLNQIVIYESRNSLQPLATYGSDDYLGFMDDDEGEWTESSSGDHTMDIGVGRIPVVNEIEADNYISKLISYQNKEAIGPWRKEVSFVAENGDQNIHQRDAERLATLIDTTYAAFNTNKIYIDAYQIEVNPGSMRAPLANEAIYDAINRGTLIINYTGHGNEVQWAKSRVFDKNVIDSLENSTYLPLFVTATCEFGRHDDVGERSGGEDLLVKKETGAIATITTARPVFSSSNYRLNLAFYQQVFEKNDGQYRRLGDIFIDTKNNSLNGVLNRNFSLLGDPSMRLSYAGQIITIDSLNGMPITNADTLSSLEELTFTGYVRNADLSVDKSFNGVAEISFLDKPSKAQTLGNLGGTPFVYNIQDNILFRGKASIINGRFSFTTILPKDISYNPANAKLTLYASSADLINDASGANIDILVGKSSNNPIVDTTPPEIRLFLGDTSFINGGVVNPNTLLIANLFDENGINTSNKQVGHSITYTLDKGEPVILDKFYSSVKDNYRQGWIYYNLPPLSEGNHVISFTAWDTSNNSTTTEVEFFVSENGLIVISDLSNYPNPMLDNTTFTFSHNLTGEEVEITLEIVNVSGQMIYKQTRSYISAPTVINDWQWDGRGSSGEKLGTGIYIYGIFLRSKNNNLGQRQYSRLFITN